MSERRWRMLAVLATVELLGMSVWFSAAAVAPLLAARWDLTAAQTGWLTTVVQLGFVAGTLLAAVLNLADIVAGRWYVAAAALTAALANVALLVAPGYGGALVLRFGTGFALAGVYPPVMKMIATWFKDGRGLAIGTIVGALTIGKATPYLVHGLQAVSIAPVVLATSAGAATGALLVAVLYRDGPHPFARRPFSWGLAGTVLRHREVRLATLGYLGHMWELYAMWTWLAAFLAFGTGWRPRAVAVATFTAIALGGVACAWGGRLADRIGRERLTARAMLVSGACAVAIGPAAFGPSWLVMGVAGVWGVAVIIDSAQFSALVTEVAPPHAVGTALTLQTSLGFLLTMVSIQLVPHLVARVGWHWAFAALAAGPALGVGAMVRLRGVRGGEVMGEGGR